MKTPKTSKTPKTPKCLHINIYGGPGAGKSTMRARLFYELKKRQYKVEEIVEYAKELTYGEDNIKLSDGLLMLARQHHPHYVLNKKVDYIITDSPFFMGMAYVDSTSEFKKFKKALHKLAISLNSSYETLNFFIEKNHEYQEYGRNHTELEADKKAKEIKRILNKNNIDYTTVKSGKDFIKTALKKIKKYRKAERQKGEKLKKGKDKHL